MESKGQLSSVRSHFYHMMVPRDWTQVSWCLGDFSRLATSLVCLWSANYPLGFPFILRCSLLSVWLLSSYQYLQPKVSHDFLIFSHNVSATLFQMLKILVPNTSSPSPHLLYLQTHWPQPWHSNCSVTASKVITANKSFFNSAFVLRWQLTEGCSFEFCDPNSWNSLPVVLCCLGSGLSCAWVCYMLL